MGETSVAASPPEPAADTDKPDWWKRRYTFTGTAVGLLFLWLSLTPSLLPRGPLFQGIVSGGAGGIGYGLGVFGVWLARYVMSRPTSPAAPRWAWLTLVGVGAVGMLIMIVLFHRWQDNVRDLMGVPRLEWFNYPQAAVISIVLLFVFVEIGQLIGRLIRYLVRLLNRIAPPRVSFVVVVAVLLSISIAVLNGVIVRAGMGVLNQTFAAVNNEMDPNNPAPTTTLRSGGPGSLVSWESLGHQGRTFVSGGPTVNKLTAFNGSPAMEPIRAQLRSRDQGHSRSGGPRIAAHRRPQQEGRRGRDDHRHRLDQRGGGLGTGVHVQRRHSDREHAVLVPAELVVIPGR